MEDIKNKTVEITIGSSDLNWNSYFTRQITRIDTWINNDLNLETKLEELDPEDSNKKPDYKKEKPKDLIIDQFLSGKNIAGVGQGRFTDIVKKKIKEKQTWNKLVDLLKGFKSYDAKSIYDHIKNLQDELISIIAQCKPKKEKQENDEENEKKTSTPWASIHSMVVALRPDLFCSVVTDNNLNALYDLLKEISPEKKDIDESKNSKDLSQIEGTKITIDFYSNSWNDLVKEWNNANDKEKVKNNMSWYYKSAAVYKFFKSCCNSDGYDKWEYDYPWEVLSALRGSERINQLKDSLINQKNLILTGAPGTGKTYLAKQIASRVIFGEKTKVEGDKQNQLKITGQYEFVQFHPSYDYTDFVEGLRPVNDAGNIVGFKRMDGVFKAFCAKAAIVENVEKDEEEKTKFVFVIDEINRGEISKIFGELFFSIDSGYRGACDEDGNDNRVKTQYQNLIAPNETFKIEDKKIIEKLVNTPETPELTGDNNSTDDTTQNAAETGAMAAKDEEYPFKEGFYVPNNVYVIGTMNDIDRSVESMDFAFRRRFAFVEITAEDSSAIIYSTKEDNGWNSDIKQSAVDRMNSLNKAIVTKCGLAPQYQIGGAYFLKLKEVGFKFDRLWSEYLQGTLYEYFRGLPANEIDEKIKLLKNAYNNGVDDDNLTS